LNRRTKLSKMHVNTMIGQLLCLKRFNIFHSAFDLFSLEC
jgi:hypothetical protein